MPDGEAGIASNPGPVATPLDAAAAQGDSQSLAAIPSSTDGAMVSTASGALMGSVSDGTRVFLSIPYAQPPVGALRFAPPVQAAAWPGVRAARLAGPMCPQYGDPISDAIEPKPDRAEDCLTLDVYAPAVPGAPRPVMVFFHGGGFTTGGSALYDGRALSRAGDVIVVTVNYRLGPLGFLAHAALDTALGMPSGNMGMRDQQLALRWVRDQISAFGGDPERVTVFGQSAGSVSTCLHMVMPESAGLASGFILESGACAAGETAPWTRQKVTDLAQKLVDELCAGKTDIVGCLRDLPASSLTSWVPSDPVRDTVLSLISISVVPGQDWWPHIDGQLIPDHPLTLIRAGAFAAKPFIVGSTNNEWSLQQHFGFPEAKSKVDLEFWANLMVQGYPLDRLRTRYTPATDAEANAYWLRMWSDMWFRCASRVLARAAADRGVDAYLYNFDVAPAAHTEELDYVFGWPEGKIAKLFPGVAPSPPTANLVSSVQALWTSYAHTGKPVAPGIPEWPAYTRAQDPHLQIAAPITAGTGLSSADCDLWDSLWNVQ